MGLAKETTKMDPSSSALQAQLSSFTVETNATLSEILRLCHDLVQQNNRLQYNVAALQASQAMLVERLLSQDKSSTLTASSGSSLSSSSSPSLFPPPLSSSSSSSSSSSYAPQLSTRRNFITSGGRTVIVDRESTGGFDDDISTNTHQHQHPGGVVKAGSTNRLSDTPGQTLVHNLAHNLAHNQLHNQMLPKMPTGAKISKSQTDLKGLLLDGDGEESAAPVAAPKKLRWYQAGKGKVDLTKVSKMENDKQEAIYELETTEVAYIQDIQALKQSYFKVLSDLSLVTSEEFNTLFANVTSLPEYNQVFLDAIQQKRSESSLIEVIGDAFFSLKVGFSAYEKYCANHVKATKLLKKLLTNTEFKKIHDQIHFENPESRQQSLESFLIKPVQRICKYPLIIKEIMKSTATNSIDHPYLLKGMELLENCLKNINEKMPGAHEEERILLLQSQIESVEPLNLADGSRRLLFEGKVTLDRDGKTKERYFILFTDKLLVCSINKSIFGNLRYLLKYEIATDEFLINANPKYPVEGQKDPEKLEKKKNYFQFVWAGNAKFGVYCDSEAEKDKLVKLLDSASMNLYRERKKNSFGKPADFAVPFPKIKTSKAALESEAYEEPKNFSPTRKRSSSFEAKPVKYSIPPTAVIPPKPTIPIPLPPSHQNQSQQPTPAATPTATPNPNPNPPPISAEDVIVRGREINRLKKSGTVRHSADVARMVHPQSKMV